ncbi:MAG: MlaD family protein [Planctomycetota bacterium]|nr:MlaD family protein [Planctomycetota bacterium]
MSDANRDFKIGLTTVGGFAALTAILFSFGELDALFKKTYEVTVKADRGGGLRAGSLVMFNGVAVGTVQTVALDTDSTEPVVLTLLIETANAIPANAEASADASLLGGGASLDFILPRDSPPPTAFLPKDGSAVVHASFKGLDERLLAALQENFGDMDQTLQSITRLANNLDTLVAEVPEDSAEAEFNVRTSVRRLNRLLKTAELAFDGASAILTDEQFQADIRSAVWRANTLIEEATVAMRALGSLAGTIELRAQELEPVVESMRSTLVHVEAIATEAREGKGTIGQLMSNPDLYNSLEDSADRLRSTLAEMELLLRKVREEGLDVKF